MNSVQFSSVQFSRSVVSDSLRSHELQHTRPPCPSPTPGVHPNSCPLSQWCHSAISSSVVPFFSCPQSLPASGSFPMSQFLASMLKLISIESMMPSNHLILCCPLLLPSSIFPRIRVFSNESVLCIRWQKDWNFSFSISSPNEYSGLISFRIIWWSCVFC